MSYSETFPFSQQAVTCAPAAADLTLFDHQTISQFMQTTVDPAIDFENTLRADLTTWNWLDTLGSASAPNSIQQNYPEVPPAPITFTDSGDTMMLNPMAQPFQHNATVYQPAPQDGFITFDGQATSKQPEPTDKMEELMSMFADFQAKTDQRMTLIENEIQAVKSRLGEDTTRLCKEVDDAISRLQNWTGQVREAVDDALRFCAAG